VRENALMQIFSRSIISDVRGMQLYFLLLTATIRSGAQVQECTALPLGMGDFARKQTWHKDGLV